MTYKSKNTLNDGYGVEYFAVCNIFTLCITEATRPALYDVEKAIGSSGLTKVAQSSRIWCCINASCG